MDCDPDLAAAHIAAAIGEPARARMLFALLDGQALTSSELAIIAQVGFSTASVHLKRLAEAGLVSVAGRGRFRDFFLAGPEVARILESLGALAAAEPRRPRVPAALRAARSCYDHLAGELAVALLDQFLAREWLAAEGAAAFRLGPAGADGFAGLGVDLAGARARRRAFAPACLDWSERRPHLAGALGAAVLEAALARGWVERELVGRALTVSDRGRRQLAKLGVEVAAA